MALYFRRYIPLHEVGPMPKLRPGGLSPAQGHLGPRVNWGLRSGKRVRRRKQCLGGFLWQAWASVVFLERLLALWLELWTLRERTFVSIASGMESQKSVRETLVL